LKASDWKVSTAVVVDGILRLITSNPKADANFMLTPDRSTREKLAGLTARKDRSPLRPAFIAKQDAVIYQLVLNYLAACDQLFWQKAKPQSFITKTVGVQALFDILRKLAGDAFDKRVISTASFVSVLSGAGDIDFSEDEYRNASGSGRSIIRRAIEEKIGLGKET
ncbi:MAG: hypothetical protein NTX28_05880, partial [Novosphingobium sp.]|nr:hypothetical protein [Novosphingobium sp.]